MADASNLGVKVLEDKIVVEPETAKICRYFEIDPLQLISSGALLIATEPEKTRGIIDNLGKEQIYAAEIGEFQRNIDTRLLAKKDGSVQDLPRPLSDHLWLALKK
jgi:hydrogenase maturation factor